MASPDIKTLALGLGWFSIGLGLGELLAPKPIKRNVGTPGSVNLLRLFGLREIGSGLLILCSRHPVRMVWGRVAGDLLDLATLFPALGKRGYRRAAAAAFGFVTLATALDIFVALHSDHDR